MATRLLTTAVGVVALGLSLNAPAAIVTFIVPLDGHQEVTSGGVPDQGDLDGLGTATLLIDDVANSIDWSIIVGNIVLPPTGAHIHQAAANTTGPIRIDFSAQLTGTGLVDADLATLLGNPTGFYVNIHNEQFAAGAIRGQLGSPVPAPPALALFAIAFAAALTRLRRRQLPGLLPGTVPS